MGEFGKQRRASIAATLANAMKKAERAARVEGAIRRGMRVLWAGGVGVGCCAWFLGQDADAVGRNVAIVFAVAWATAVGGDWGVSLKQRAGRRGRRDLAFLAARRLEKRFPEQTGIFVAAVDFSAEETLGIDDRSPVSSALRNATVDAATRRFAEIEATLDAAELNAALTNLPSKRFRKSGKMAQFCALGVLANLAIWGGTAGKEAAFRAVEAKKVERVERASENRKDKGNGEVLEEERDKRFAEIKENSEEIENASTTQETSVPEEIALAALELFLAELAQNAEIAETLQAELKSAAANESGEGERSGTFDATQCLRLARELKGNLTRPETGLIAQTKRLSEAAARRRQIIEERLRETAKTANSSEVEKKEKVGGISKINKIGEIEKTGENEKGKRTAQGIAGKEIALSLAAARWATLETALTEPGGIGDVASLELSRLARSDSATARRKTATEAAANVGEWGAALRREETAARIWSESWRFDATSQQRTALTKRAWEENRTLLIRFAGRLTANAGKTGESSETLEEAKRRFKALWEEAQGVERERVAIFERLRERLQSEESQEFRDFVQRCGGLAGDERFWGVEADETAVLRLNDALSRNRRTWNEIAEHIENNRFGAAGERWQEGGDALEESLSASGDEKNEPQPKGNANEGTINAEIKEDGADEVDGVAEKKGTEELESERRRFSALAALLTQGIAAEATREIVARQSVENKDVAAFGKGEEIDGLTLKNEKARKNAADAASQNERKGDVFDAMSPKEKNAETRASSEKNKETSNDATDGKTKSSDDAATTTDGDQSETENAKTATNATERQTGGRPDASGAESAGNDAAERERLKTEPPENKAFLGELPPETRRRFEETKAPEILPEYAEKIRLYRRRILEEKR